MRSPLRRLQPTNGISYFLHLGLLLLLPAAAFLLVRLNLALPAAAIVILSKWRMFAVRPRFWAANIRANSVDLMVGLSAVLFMTHYDSVTAQLAWAALYAIWLTVIKPGSGMMAVMFQAFIGQLVALTALYLTWASAPVYALTALTGLFCFLAAHHFFDTFDEPYAKMLAYFWGYFGAALGWLLSHWLLYYRGLALPTLLLSVLGYGIAGLYYQDHTGKLNKTLRWQIIAVMVVVVLVVIIGWPPFAKWGSKVV